MLIKLSVSVFIGALLSVAVINPSNAQSTKPTYFVQTGSGFMPITGIDEFIEGDRFGRVGTLPFYIEGGLVLGHFSLGYYYGHDNEKASGTFRNFPKTGAVHIHGLRLGFRLFSMPNRVNPFLSIMYSQTNKLEVVPNGFGLNNTSFHLGFDTRLLNNLYLNSRVGYGSSLVEFGLRYGFVIGKH
jgi:hypothetical protein